MLFGAFGEGGGSTFVMTRLANSTTAAGNVITWFVDNCSSRNYVDSDLMPGLHVRALHYMGLSQSYKVITAGQHELMATAASLCVVLPATWGGLNIVWTFLFMLYPASGGTRALER